MKKFVHTMSFFQSGKGNKKSFEFGRKSIIQKKYLSLLGILCGLVFVVGLDAQDLTILDDGSSSGNFCQEDQVTYNFFLSNQSTSIYDVDVDLVTIGGAFVADITSQPNAVGAGTTTTPTNGVMAGNYNLPSGLAAGIYRIRIIATENNAGDGSSPVTQQSSNIDVIAPQLNTTSNLLMPPAPVDFLCVGDDVQIEFSHICLRSSQGFNSSGSGNVRVDILDADNSNSLVTSVTTFSVGGTASGSNRNSTTETATFEIPSLPFGNYRFRVSSTNGFETTTEGNLTAYEVRNLAITNPDPFPRANATYCPGELLELDIDGDNTVTFNANNQFRVILSDPSGDFDSGNNTLIGRVISTTLPNSIDATIPYEVLNGTDYRIRIESTSPAELGCEYGPISISPIWPFSGPADDLQCLDAQATFTANPTPNSYAGTSQTWIQMCADTFVTNKQGLNSTSIQDFEISGSNIYAATGLGIARSTDNGATFTPYSNLDDDYISAIAISSNRVYAADGNELQISGTDGLTNTGTGFSPQTPLGVTAINNIFIDNAAGDIYLATPQGVYFNNQLDGSGAWVRYLNSEPTNSVFVADFGSGVKHVYAATSTGLWISRTAGSGNINFTEQYDDTNTNNNGLGGIANPVINDVYVDVTKNIIYLGTAFGVAISTDNAFSFETYFSGLESVSVLEVAVFNNANYDLLFASTTEGLGILNIGSKKFTTYINEDGLGSDVVTRVVGQDNAGAVDMFIGTLGGLTKTTFSFSNAGSNSASQNITINSNSNYDGQASCRYFQVFSGTLNGQNCSGESGMARLANIPPQIFGRISDTIAVCGGRGGAIEITGLIPGVEYTWIRSENDSVGSVGLGNNPLIADSLGSFSLTGLSAGTYGITVQSLVNPPVIGCTSNTIILTLTDPVPPSFSAAVTPDTICVGESVMFTLPALAENEQYQWFTDVSATTAASPPTSMRDGTNPIMYTLDGFPTSRDTLGVRIYNSITKCISDTIPAAYVVTQAPNISKVGGSGVVITDDITGVATVAFDGLTIGETYTLSYDFTPIGGTTTTTIVTLSNVASTTFSINNVPRGDLSNIVVTFMGCSSNTIAFCPVRDADDLTEDDENVKEVAFSQDTVCATNDSNSSGYLQATDNDASCTGGDQVVYDSDGIPVGRIRDPEQPVTNGTDNVELRGYVRFDLAAMGIPAGAIIDKIEYQAVTVDSIGIVCEVPLESATGDVQFDISQVDTSNYAPYTLGFDQNVFDDLGEFKYADFTVSKSSTSAWTDLGPQAVIDVKNRLEFGGDFQLGLRLSGNDFDLALYQFHGIVFAPGDQHKLRITYHTLDFGDLPEPKYITDLAGGIEGPSHRIDQVDVDIDPNNVIMAYSSYIGATPPDGEFDGQISEMANGDDNDGNDDEDLGVNNFFNPATNLAETVNAGRTTELRFNVVNNLTIPTRVYAFADWNSDGDFRDEEESKYIDVPARDGSITTNIDDPIAVAISFDVPTNASMDSFAVRVRIATDTLLDENGPASNGEVEDFLYPGVFRYDYGDLPDISSITGTGDYQTLFDNSGTRGPRHLINDSLRIGNLIDAEDDGQPQVNAFGDDIAGVDDEDGIIAPDTILRDEPAIFSVFVVNETSSDAYLMGFVDWDDDGDFEDDPAFSKSGPITIAPGASGYYQVTFDVPPMPVPLPDRVGTRFRLSNENVLVQQSTGPAFGTQIYGEVQDLFVDIAGYDWGDLPEPRYITDSQGGFPGPSHKIVGDDNGDITLFIGDTAPDAERDGIPSAQADGDDEVVDAAGMVDDRIDDEDLTPSNFTFPGTTNPYTVIAGSPIDFIVPATNNTGSDATLWAFIDWNGDGDFKDDEEARFLTVPTGSDDVDFTFEYRPVPFRPDPDSIGVRVRLTTGEIFDAYGPAQDGEVEDFIIELRGSDFGDLPDVTVGVGPNDFQTLNINEGPRHGVPVIPLLILGDTVDTEVDGQPNGDADGDDTNPIIDDEDGIIFLTPLVPGKEASISFSGSNASGADATLYMWADWENDGTLTQVTFNNIGSETLGNGTSAAGRIMNFTVPTTATFEQGSAYFRFRLTSDSDFAADPQPIGMATDGEVEDYFVPIFQIGNLVWEDRNNNGRQDAEEIPLGIDDVRVVLRFGGIDRITGEFDAVNQNTILDPNTPAIDGDLVADFICDTLTADNGLYNFFGLIEGNYQIIAVDSFDLTPTRVDWLDNVTEEDLDSDGKGLKLPWEYIAGDIRQSKSQVFELNRDSVGTDEEGILDQLNPELQDPNQLTAFPDNRFEQRVDFGYTGFDLGDLDSTYITVEDGIDIGTTTAGLFPTDTVLIGNALEGPKHIVDPVVYLGSCSDAEVIGHPDYDAGAEFALALDDPALPVDYTGDPLPDGRGDDPFDSGWNTTDGNDTLTCDDDENGVMFMTPLIPGYPAIIDVDFYTTINYDGPDAFLQAYIDWNGDGDFYVDGDPAMGIDPNEHIVFTHLNGDTLLLEKNTLAVELEMYTREVYRPIRLQFDVPSDAKMNDGNVHARFRIGKSPNLGPTGILPGNENFPDGIVPEGEVEDYFMKLSKVGNLVWEDRDYDGIQDIDEPVIAGVKITLDYHGIDTFPNGDFYEMQYETVTDENGKYYFCGLIGNVDPSGIMKPTYALTADDPEDMTPTANRDTFPFRELSNGVVYNSDGNDDNIDDLTTTVEFAILNPMDLCVGEAHPNGINDMTDSLVMDMDGIADNRSIADNVWPDCQIDETLDFGYVGMDYGDLPDTTLTDADEYEYWTRRDWLPGSTPNDFGARHAIQPRLFLGDGVDGELDGQPDILAGSKGDNGDDADTSAFRQGTGVDDENGIRLMTPLLPGEFAYIQVRYTSQDTLLAGGYEDTTAYLNAFIDWNGDGEYYLDVANPAGGTDAEEAILFTHQGSTPTSLAALGTATTNPALPGGVDQVQYLGFRVPDTMRADFFDGRAFMRFRLSFEGLLDPDNFRYHQEAPPHVVYSPNPGGPVKGPALDWDWDDPLQRYPRGEVEDYAVPLAKVGNLSWYDHNVNGRQDMTTEALYNTYRDSFGVDTLHLVLIWGGLEADGTFDAVGFQDTDMDTDGTVSDILYNWSIVPQIDGTFTDYMTPNYDPTDTLKTTPDGLFSFRGLIPGNYYLIPLKYLQADSTDFVNFWPKHRVLTVKNNQTMTDSLDSDAGPGAEFTINDINPNDPEVCVGDLPTGEDGQLDMPDNMMDPYFPDTLYDQTIDLGWVDEPNIEASLDLVGVDFPESEECGNFNVIFHLCLKNPQETPLDSIVPFLNIRAGYGDAFVAGSAQVSIVEQAFTTNPTVECEKDQIAMNGSVDALTPFIDPAYTGEGADTFLLTGGDSETRFYLPGDSVVCIRIEFEINPAFYNPSVANNFCPWMIRGGSWARAVGFSYDPNESTPWTGGDTKVPLIDWSTKDYQGNPNDRFGRPIEVYDLSDELDDPWPGPGAYKEYGDSIRFEGFVMDRGDFGEYKIFVDKSLTGRDKYLDEDDYTIQNDSCWVKTQRLSGVDNIFITLDENCEVKLDPSTFITNHMEECGFDRYPEGSYYRVVIQDEHTGETLWASADRVPFDGAKYRDRKLIYKARSVANHCEVIWGRITLEDKTPPVVTCPDPVDESAIGRPLVCADIEDILNNPRTWTDPDYVYYTGMATADDNCDGSEAIFDGANDVLEVLSDCDESAAAGYVYARIVRTFKFRDASGNEGTCSQEILFRRPQIILPECEVYLDICEVGDDEELTPADLIAKYERLMSVPYYIDGAGENVYLTEDEACGFGIFWENSAVFGKDNCGYKIERTWSIRDWCYGVGTDYPNYLDKPVEDAACYEGVDWTIDGAYSWKQLLVVGDTVAPFVTIPDLDEDGFKGVNGYKDGPTADPTVSTESFDAEDVYEFTTGNECSASFSVTKDMFEISGECRDWCFDLDLAIRRPVLDLDERPIPGEFEFVPVDEANITGDCDGGYWVFDVPMDLDPTHYYFFKMRVYDECNNDTLIYAPFRVIDDTKPVVICDDNIRVTFDNFGTGSLAAVDVDEGTSDNCDKILWLKVRRPVGDCTDGFRGMLSYVDANNNSIIDEADYIDENNNNAPDELEYFQIDEDGVLMSPLLDKIPFFCCDPDSVKVELWASDKFGNRSNCWQYALLENRPDISLELPGNFILPESQVYDCTEEEDNVVLLANSSGIYAQGSLTYNAAVALLGGDLFILQDNTCGGFTREMEVTSEFDQCGFGQIKVRWILTAGSELPPPHTPESLTTDYRTIDIIEKHDYWIKFPKDTYVNCATPNPDTIEVSSEACDLIAVATLPDERFETPQDPNSCYKIFRTYRVINWCEYDGQDIPVIVSRDWDAHNGTDCTAPINGDDDVSDAGEYNMNPQKPDGDGTAGNSDIYVIVDSRGSDAGNNREGIVYYDNDADPFNNSTDDPDTDLVEGYWWAVSVDDNCAPSTWYDDEDNPGGDLDGSDAQDDDDNRYGSHGFWQYTQHIIVYDDVDPELTVALADTFYSINNTDCAADISFTVDALDLCNGDTTNLLERVVINNEDVTFNLVDGTFTGRYGEGKHTVIVTARDACGNVATFTGEFEVVDGKAPAPIIREDMVVELGRSDVDTTGGGSATIWANDFEASPIYDCNGQDGSDTDAFGNPRVTKYSINRVGEAVDENQTGLSFTCADVGTRVEVEIHAWDELGNHDFARTFVEVQDNIGACDVEAGAGSIAGLVATPENRPVNEVEVRLSGEAQRNFMTNATGTYAFTELAEDSDYTVIPSKDDFDENGLSTFDVILMQKHIVGSDLLDSPYKLIAADINRSGDITTLDLIQLRKMVLGVDTKFSSNTSWRFVDADYIFPTDVFSQPFPEVKNINNLEGDEEVNFIAIKIGDLNGSADAYVQPRSNESLGLIAKAETRMLEAGVDYRIDFSSEELVGVQGYQFSLELGDVELIETIYGQAKADHFGIFRKEGLITTSWNGQGAEGNLFSLVIRPSTDIALSDAVRIGSRKTEAEAYNAEGEIMDINLEFEVDGAQVIGNALFQNTPNPFQGETQIRFFLGEAQRASLKIRDVTGKLVKVIEGDFAQGRHEVRLRANELPSAGVYFYTLEAGDYLATRKLIVLDEVTR